jgi:hypothetical protein
LTECEEQRFYFVAKSENDLRHAQMVFLKKKHFTKLASKVADKGAVSHI